MTENDSLPWSKSSPKGLDEFVLLACFPSTASNVWKYNIFREYKWEFLITHIKFMHGTQIHKLLDVSVSMTHHICKMPQHIVHRDSGMGWKQDRETSIRGGRRDPTIFRGWDTRKPTHKYRKKHTKYQNMLMIDHKKTQHPTTNLRDIKLQFIWRRNKDPKCWISWRWLEEEMIPRDVIIQIC